MPASSSSSLGTGLLKPNISAIVGQLYAPDDKRRDAGFSIFYMGINTGALIGPIVCGYLRQKVGWHWGFGAAGVGMTFGVIQYVLGQRRSGGAGPLKETPQNAGRSVGRASSPAWSRWPRSSTSSGTTATTC